MSGQKRQEAIKSKSLVTKITPFPNFKMYEFFIDKYSDDKKAQLALEQYKLNLSIAGKKPETKPISEGGRKVIKLGK
jgi:hypothetical protein